MHDIFNYKVAPRFLITFIIRVDTESMGSCTRPEAGRTERGLSTSDLSWSIVLGRSFCTSASMSAQQFSTGFRSGHTAGPLSGRRLSHSQPWSVRIIGPFLERAFKWSVWRCAAEPRLRGCSAVQTRTITGYPTCLHLLHHVVFLFAPAYHSEGKLIYYRPP